MNNKKDNSEQNIPKRPPFFSALCLLTFIGSTTGFLGYFLAALFFDKTLEIIVKYSSWHSTEAISQLYFTLLMALYAISLSGAIRMWKLHRDGFILYVFAQLSILFIPVIWFDRHSFSETNVIFTAVFVTGYALCLKYMRR